LSLTHTSFFFPITITYRLFYLCLFAYWGTVGSA
jgi:hypothetical protein